MQKKGFTLVELIVVITLITILAVFAFNSFIIYVKESRNTRRLSDIAGITKGIDLYRINLLTYPVPTNPRDIMYNGSVLWTEGTIIRNEAFAKVMNISGGELKDPLTGNYYTYSVSGRKVEYEIGSITETDGLKSLIKGNFNGKILGQKGGAEEYYVVAVPSIISSNPSLSILDQILAHNALAYSGFGNLPSSYYKPSIFNNFFTYTPTKVSLFTGAIDNFVTVGALQGIGHGIQQAYSGTVLQNFQDYKFYQELDLNNASSYEYIKILVKQTFGF